MHKLQFLHICNNTCYLSCFKIAILMGVRLYLIVLLICISLIISDIEHLLCLLSIYIFSLKHCVFKSCAYILIILFGFFCCCVVGVLYI